MPSRLKSLELIGYKTFAPKTLFLFGERITAVVGPNGSGKSNIADSIRWVLGEQSFSLLRGKKTEDMIFAGSELRPRANVAQATVTFDNSTGWLPIEFAEVSIGRRAYRDGQNEYLLNGQRTRLRDIAELLGKVGLSERTYTIVGQGLVDNALSLRPEDRRALFEEAAGIGIYRAKREDALRKLEQTQRNLERVHDILSEIRPRLRTLERQAQRARDYQQVKNELDGVLKAWYGFHWHESQRALAAARQNAESHSDLLQTLQREQRDIDNSLAEVRARLSTLRSQMSSWQNEMERLRTQAESLNRNLAVADERLRAFAERREQLALDLQTLDPDLQNQRRRAEEAAAELNRLHDEYTVAKAQLESLEASRAQHAADRQRAVQQAADATTRAAAIATHIAERQAHLQRLSAERERLARQNVEHEKQWAHANAVVADKRAALERLEEASLLARHQYEKAEADLQSHGDAIAAAESQLADIATRHAEAIAAEGGLAARAEVLAQTRHGLDGDESGTAKLRRAAAQSQLRLLGALADIISAPPELDLAITAALGQFVNALVLDDVDIALDLLAQADGRAALLSPAHMQRQQPPAVAHPGLIGNAAQLVNCDGTHRPLVDALLGQTVVVRSRDAAKQVAANLPPGGAAVTLGGEVFLANGAIIGGRDSGTSALALAREQRDLPAELTRARERARQLERHREQAEAQLRHLRQEWTSMTNARRELQTAERNSATERDAAQLETDRAEAQATLHRQQSDALRAQIAELDSQATGVTHELQTLTAEAAQAEADAQTLAAHTLEYSADELAEKLAEWQTKAAVAQRAALDAKTRADEMRAALGRAEAVVASRKSRFESIEAEAEVFTASLTADRARLSALNEHMARLQLQIEPATQRLAETEEELSEVESAEAAMRGNVHSAERYYADAQLDFGRKKDELDSLRRHITEDFGLVAFEYADDITGPTATPLPFEGIVEHLPHVESLPEGFEDLLNRRRSQLRRMGAINPDALNEYNEVKERNEFLTTQVGDLEEAAAQLREVIAELDALMQREFRKTFDAVAEQFKDTFARLFGGGSAKLVLTDPDNLTITGVDILARLPGRKQQGLALLSGGERALTASALIFALLRVNPPPFAMLDEVDAALDEANVGRFRDLLVEMSHSTQFVVITHNRNTVQAADTVYGISMSGDSASQAISLKLDGEKVVQE